MIVMSHTIRGRYVHAMAMLLALMLAGSPAWAQQ